jgi:hypothetical protein
MMKTRRVIFNEPLHHVCLMYGLKQTYEKMPFLNKKVLEIKGELVAIDNMVPPPPMISHPNRRSCTRGMRSLVGISYWREKLSIEYREEMCTPEDISAFVNSLIEDYIHFRHPFMKTVVKDGTLYEESTGHQIAEII